MRNIADVLRQKESELQNLEREIDALKLAMRLCSDEAERTESFKLDPATAETAVGPRPIRGVSYDEPPAQKAMKQFP